MANESSRWRFKKRLTAALLLLWAAVSFGVPYFALDLRFQWLGTPFSFWMAAQGALLVYLAIIAVYGLVMNRLDAQQAADSKAAHE
jgi:putative solute:sodium symporter small subunit